MAMQIGEGSFFPGKKGSEVKVPVEASCELGCLEHEVRRTV